MEWRIRIAVLLLGFLWIMPVRGDETSGGSTLSRIFGFSKGEKKEKRKTKTPSPSLKKADPERKKVESDPPESEALSRGASNPTRKDWKEEKAENGFIRKSLQEELKSLEESLREQRQKQEECLTKASEMRIRAEEYGAAIKRTETRIQKIRGVMQMIDENPDALLSLGASSKGPDALYSGGPGASWNPGKEMKSSSSTSSAFELGKGIPGLNDPEEMKAPLPWGELSTPVEKKNEIQEWRTDRFAGPEIEDRKTERKDESCRVLACDGEGADAIVIISAGADKGIRKGMLFAVGEGENRTILTVTQVYPTCARTVPHPRYARRKVEMNDVVTPIASLPPE